MFRLCINLLLEGRSKVCCFVSFRWNTKQNWWTGWLMDIQFLATVVTALQVFHFVLNYNHKPLCISWRFFTAHNSTNCEVEGKWCMFLISFIYSYSIHKKNWKGDSYSQQEELQQVSRFTVPVHTCSWGRKTQVLWLSLHRPAQSIIV